MVTVKATEQHCEDCGVQVGVLTEKDQYLCVFLRTGLSRCFNLFQQQLLYKPDPTVFKWFNYETRKHRVTLNASQSATPELQETSEL